MKEATKILLIEDDDFIARAYKVGLEREKFEVMIAMDGEHGNKALSDGSFNLILLDIILPRMDGFEFLEKIKKNQTYKDIPVVILSNLGQESDIERGKVLGAVDYLVKANSSMDDVVKVIREHLR